MCVHRLGNDPTGLLCTRTSPHDTGHTYESSDGSSVPDRHDRPGRGDGE